MISRLDKSNYSEEAVSKLSTLDIHRINFDIRRDNGVIIPVELDKNIKDAIDMAISNAPDENDYNSHEVGDHTIAIKFPDDTHLLPLLERSLFEKLISIAGESSETLNMVSPRTLMFMDPSLPEIDGVNINGVEIHPETALQHELEHALKAQSLGTSNGFITLTFYWKKDGRYNVLDFDAEWIDPNIVSGNYTASEIDSIVRAPHYPSKTDLKPLFISYIESRANLWQLLQASPIFLKRLLTKHLNLDPITHDSIESEVLKKWLENLRENAKEPIFNNLPLTVYKADVEVDDSGLPEDKDINKNDYSPFTELRELDVSSRSFPSEGDFEILTNLKTLEFTTNEMLQECASHIIEIAHKLEAFEVVAVTGKSRGFTLDLLTSAGVDQSKIVQLNSDLNSQMYKWDSELTIEQKRELLLREINEQIPGIDFVKSICVAEDQIASGAKASSYLSILGGIDDLENFGYSSFVNPRAITHASNEELVQKFGEASVQSFSRLIYPENSSNGVDGIIHILSRVCSRMDDENLLRDKTYSEPTKEMVNRLVSGILVRIKSEIVRQIAQMTTDAIAAG